MYRQLVSLYSAVARQTCMYIVALVCHIYQQNICCFISFINDLSWSTTQHNLCAVDCVRNSQRMKTVCWKLASVYHDLCDILPDTINICSELLSMELPKIYFWYRSIHLTLCRLLGSVPFWDSFTSCTPHSFF